MLNQLSYEATDVGSRSIVGSYVPVKKMSVNDIWNKSYMNCGNEMKMKKWSSQWTQFMKLRKEKNSGLQRGLNPWPFEPDTSQFMQLRKEAWKKIRSRVHTKLKSWSFFRLLLRNCINCIHCDDHFFIFISFPQFIYDLFHISLAKQGQMDNGQCRCWRGRRLYWGYAARFKVQVYFALFKLMQYKDQ